MASDPLWNHVQTEIACPFAKRLQEKWDAAFCLQVSTEQTRSYPVAPGRSACSTGNVSSKLVVDTSHVTWVRQVRVCSIARQPSLIIGITKRKEAPNITQPAAGGCRKDVRNSPQRLVHFFWLSRGPDHPDVIEALLLRLLQNPTFSGVLWTVTVSCALNKHAECLQCGKDMSHSKLSNEWDQLLLYAETTRAFPPRCPCEFDTPTTREDGNRSARNKVLEPWPNSLKSCQPAQNGTFGTLTSQTCWVLEGRKSGRLWKYYEASSQARPKISKNQSMSQKRTKSTQEWATRPQKLRRLPHPQPRSRMVMPSYAHIWFCHVPSKWVCK